MTVTPIVRSAPLRPASRYSPVFIAQGNPPKPGSAVEAHPCVRPGVYIGTRDNTIDTYIAPGGETFGGGAAQTTPAMIGQRYGEWAIRSGWTLAALTSSADPVLPITLNGFGGSWRRGRIWAHPLDAMGTYGLNPATDYSPRCRHAIAEVAADTTACALATKAYCDANGLRYPTLLVLDVEQSMVLYGAGAYTLDTTQLEYNGQAGPPTYGAGAYTGWIAAMIADVVGLGTAADEVIYQDWVSGAWVDRTFRDFKAAYLDGASYNLGLSIFDAANAAILPAVYRIMYQNMSYRLSEGVYKPWRSVFPACRTCNYQTQSSTVAKPWTDIFGRQAVMPRVQETLSGPVVYPEPHETAFDPAPGASHQAMMRNYWDRYVLSPAAASGQPFSPFLWAPGSRRFNGSLLNGYDLTQADAQYLVGRSIDLGCTVFQIWNEQAGGTYPAVQDDGDLLPLVEFGSRYAQPRSIAAARAPQYRMAPAPPATS